MHESEPIESVDIYIYKYIYNEITHLLTSSRRCYDKIYTVATEQNLMIYLQRHILNQENVYTHCCRYYSHI